METGRSTLNITRLKNLIIYSGKWIYRLNRSGMVELPPRTMEFRKKNVCFSYQRRFFLTLCCFMISCFAFSQVDTLKTISKSDSVPVASVDSMIKVEHSPRKAAIRSAILPGWGQIYNRKYWKLPIVYAALGVTGYIFVDNLKVYKDLKIAYR